MATIDGLFEQIIHIEKAAEKRKNKLLELKQEIIDTQTKGQQIAEISKELKKHIKTKLDELGNEEALIVLLESQKLIASSKKCDLEKQIHELTERETVIYGKLRELKETFCDRLTSFCSSYGLDNNGRLERENNRKELLAKLKLQSEELATYLDSFTKSKMTEQNLLDRKQHLQTQKDQLQQEIIALDGVLAEDSKVADGLERQCKVLKDFPQTDQQYCSLDRQLSEEKQKSIDLNHQLSQLQSKLHTLHQQLWHKQLQQQQHHQ